MRIFRILESACWFITAWHVILLELSVINAITLSKDAIAGVLILSIVVVPCAVLLSFHNSKYTGY